MKKIILSIAIFFLANTQSFGHVEHYAKYNYLEYELFRNDNSIGYHKYDFKRKGENLSILSEVSFKITKLGVDLYKYFAKSEENYEKGIELILQWMREVETVTAQSHSLLGQAYYQTGDFKKAI